MFANWFDFMSIMSEWRLRQSEAVTPRLLRVWFRKQPHHRELIFDSELIHENDSFHVYEGLV